MKDFDKAAAKRGAKVCTRNGWTARILCFDRKGGERKIVAALLRPNGEEDVAIFYDDGRYYINDTSPFDIMMSDDDYLEKLERGEYDTTPKQKYGWEDIPDICRTIGAAVDALANMDFSQMNKGRVSESDHIGEPTEKVEDSRSIGNEWLNDMIKSGTSIFKEFERRLDIERQKYELSKLKHEADMLELERIPENWDYWRRMYAGMAMQGLCVAHGTRNSAEHIARGAVKCADAIIEELKK